MACLLGCFSVRHHAREAELQAVVSISKEASNRPAAAAAAAASSSQAPSGRRPWYLDDQAAGKGRQPSIDDLPELSPRLSLGLRLALAGGDSSVSYTTGATPGPGSHLDTSRLSTPDRESPPGSQSIRGEAPGPSRPRMSLLSTSSR